MIHTITTEIELSLEELLAAMTSGKNAYSTSFVLNSWIDSRGNKSEVISKEEQKLFRDIKEWITINEEWYGKDENTNKLCN